MMGGLGGIACTLAGCWWPPLLLEGWAVASTFKLISSVLLFLLASCSCASPRLPFSACLLRFKQQQVKLLPLLPAPADLEVAAWV